MAMSARASMESYEKWQVFGEYTSRNELKFSSSVVCLTKETNDIDWLTWFGKQMVRPTWNGKAAETAAAGGHSKQFREICWNMHCQIWAAACLRQRFSTCGPRTLRGPQGASKGSVSKPRKVMFFLVIKYCLIDGYWRFQYQGKLNCKKVFSCYCDKDQVQVQTGHWTWHTHMFIMYTTTFGQTLVQNRHSLPIKQNIM